MPAHGPFLVIVRSSRSTFGLTAPNIIFGFVRQLVVILPKFMF